MQYIQRVVCLNIQMSFNFIMGLSLKVMIKQNIDIWTTTGTTKVATKKQVHLNTQTHQTALVKYFKK